METGERQRGKVGKRKVKRVKEKAAQIEEENKNETLESEYDT